MACSILQYKNKGDAWYQPWNLTITHKYITPLRPVHRPNYNAL